MDPNGFGWSRWSRMVSNGVEWIRMGTLIFARLFTFTFRSELSFRFLPFDTFLFRLNRRLLLRPSPTETVPTGVGAAEGVSSESVRFRRSSGLLRSLKAFFDGRVVRCGSFYAFVSLSSIPLDSARSGRIEGAEVRRPSYNLE